MKKLMKIVLCVLAIAFASTMQSYSQNPIASFTPSKLVVCVNNSIDFINNSYPVYPATSIVKWKWYFGTGVSPVMDTIHWSVMGAVFQQAGMTVNATLTVTDNLGNTSQTSQMISVPVWANPQIYPQNNPSLCKGDTLQMQVKPNVGVTYQWSLDNINISGATDSVHTAKTQGYYGCDVTDKNGCTWTTYRYVQYNQPENPKIQSWNKNNGSMMLNNGDTVKICSGDDVNTNAVIDYYGPNVNVVWSNGSVGAYATATVTLGGIPMTGETTMLTINGAVVALSEVTGSTLAQEASVLAALINSNATISTFVTASSIGTVITLTANTMGTAGNSISLSKTVGVGMTATVSGATLTGGTNTSPGQSGQSFSTNVAGSYSYTVTSNGCSEKSGTFVVKVLPLPNPIVTGPTDSIFCFGDTLPVLKLQNYSLYSHVEWGQGKGWSNAINIDTFAVNYPGAYGAEVTDQNGCIAMSKMWNFYFNPMPNKPTVSPNQYQPGCHIWSDNAPGCTYQWLLNDTVLTGETTQYLDVSKYGSGFYKMRVTNSSGCSETSDPNYASCSATGILEFGEKRYQQVMLSQNPAHGSVEVFVSERSEVQLISVVGAVVKSEIVSSNIVFDLYDVPSGIYIVKTISKNGTGTQKLMVQK